jgi:thymidine phosphorylase
MLERTLSTGAAAERFQRMVAALGGPRDFVDQCEKHLPMAPIIRPVFAKKTGKIQAIDTRALGLAVIELGGGRPLPRTGSSCGGIIGLWQRRSVSDRPLAMIHARDGRASTGLRRSKPIFWAGTAQVAAVLQRIK